MADTTRGRHPAVPLLVGVGDGAETDNHRKGDREDVLGILPVA
jgi:hypothetical protein